MLSFTIGLYFSIHAIAKFLVINRSDSSQLSLPDVVLSRKQAEIKEETDKLV